MRLDTALPPVSRPPPASTHHLFDHLGKLVTFHVFKTSAFEGPKFGDGGFFSSPSFGRPVLKFRAGGGAERLGLRPRPPSWHAPQHAPPRQGRHDFLPRLRGARRHGRGPAPQGRDVPQPGGRLRGTPHPLQPVRRSPIAIVCTRRCLHRPPKLMGK